MQTHCELLALIDRDRNFFFSFFKNLYFYQDDEVSKNSGSTTERGFSRLSMLCYASNLGNYINYKFIDSIILINNYRIDFKLSL